MEDIKLLCFSHAGGSATKFLPWKSYFKKKGIEIIPVELSGRGLRMDEDLTNDIESIVQDLFQKVKDIVKNYKYAVIGHSMGCLIMYELCDYIISQGYPGPVHIFASGKEAPHVKEKKFISDLNDEKFLNEIYSAGGTEEELLTDEDIKKIFLPILRNDYTLVEEYKIKRVRRFDCGITVLNGNQDTIPEDDLFGWSLYANKEFNIVNFDGGHFFLYDYPERVAQIINDRTKLT